jgi:hypothetical protein
MAVPSPSPTPPICPMCSEPIHPGESVAFVKGQMVHVKCYTKGREERKQPPPPGERR